MRNSFLLGKTGSLATTLTFFLLLTATGCDSQSSVAPLSGKVTYQGTPLEFGSVAMQPKSGGPLARATIQPDGTFVMRTNGVEGAPLGENQVRVTCFPGQKPGITGGDGNDELSLGHSLIPDRYTRFSGSGLSVNVKPGDNEPYLIELTD